MRMFCVSLRRMRSNCFPKNLKKKIELKIFKGLGRIQVEIWVRC